MKQVQLNLDLSSDQDQALALLRSGENVFLSGGAGSGKSFLVRHFIREMDPKTMPLLASTGAAAVLIGGRTFHSFFGLGIMDGGPAATLERALMDKRLLRRVQRIEGFIIDEISMISGQTLAIAEEISRKAKGSSLPWGGLRVIAVGDFAQLPPVTRQGPRDWAFLHPVWGETGFQSQFLSLNHRVQDKEYLSVVQDVRFGKVTPQVQEYLNSRTVEHDEEDEAIRLFPRREQSEKFNQLRLTQLSGKAHEYLAVYFGEDRFVESLKRNSPVPEKLVLKEGAVVMFVQNDPTRRWVNGTRGTVVDLDEQKLIVQLKNGRDVELERSLFSLQDAEGKVMASVLAYPVVLAYATTIHKSQGATLDKLWVDLSALWEPGQAYVALSRLPFGTGLHLLRWSPRSIIIDPKVAQFYRAT